MDYKEKCTDILILLILAILVINWETLLTVSNIIVIASGLLGIIYIITSMIKESIHYKLVLSIVMVIEVVPAFLLKGELDYTIAAIVLLILMVFKQVKLRDVD